LDKEQDKDKKGKIYLDIPRFAACMIALIIGIIYYYVFNLMFDIPPYDAHLTDTAVFMDFEKDRMNIKVYMFYANKNKSRERKQFLLFPIISDKNQKKPDNVEFKEKTLPPDFSLNKVFQSNDNLSAEALDKEAGYNNLESEMTGYGTRLWLKIGPSEKKVIKASFSQILTPSENVKYSFKYDFSNSKAWAKDLNSVYYFITLPAPAVLTATDLMERKNMGEKMHYWSKYYYPKHLYTLGGFARNGSRPIDYKEGETIPPTGISEEKIFYTVQYKNGFDPGIGFYFEDSKSLYNNFKEGGQ